MSRSDFIQRFRQRSDLNPALEEVSPEQRNIWCDHALDEYTRFRPRMDVSATVSLVSNSNLVILPRDLLPPPMTPDDAFYQLIGGGVQLNQVLPIYGFPDRFYLNPPVFPQIPVDRPRLNLKQIQLTFTKEKRWCLMLELNPGYNRDVTLIYNARHMVEDEHLDPDIPSVNTLDPQGEQWVMQRMEIYQLQYLAKRYAPLNQKLSESYSSMAESSLRTLYQSIQRIGY